MFVRISGVLLCLLVAGVARADARIAVRLTDAEGRPVDGTVTMTKPGLTRSCRTTASRCTITAPAGSYTVTMRPVRGTAPPPRTMAVPASGTISLALRARPASTMTGTTVASTTQPAVRATRTTTAGTTATGTTSVTSTTTRTAARAVRPRITRTTRATRVRRTTAIRPATTSATGSTSGGSGSGEILPGTAVTSASGVVQRAGTAEPRDLTRGRTLVVSGTVLDAAGRPVDATLTLRRNGAVVGTAHTTAGRFSLYDLSAAAYDVSLASSRGTTGTGRITVGSTTSRVTLRVN